MFISIGFGLVLHRILIRPHPAFWRFIHGIAVVYLVFLTFLLFQVCFSIHTPDYTNATLGISQMHLMFQGTEKNWIAGACPFIRVLCTFGVIFLHISTGLMSCIWISWIGCLCFNWRFAMLSATENASPRLCSRLPGLIRDELCEISFSSLFICGPEAGWCTTISEASAS